MIKLKEESMEILKYCFKKYDDSLVERVENPNITDYTEDFYNQLRQIVGDELVARGFDENYKPNDYGIRLENLIDEIGRLFM